MPTQVPLLLFDRLLKHGLQSTISAPHRSSCSCRIAQRPPSAGGRDEMDLSIERPLSPLLAHSITHHHSRHVAVHALMRLVGPVFENLDTDDLHVEELDVGIESRHFTHEYFAPTPCALGILSEHLPHFVEPAFRMQPHEAHLKCCRCDRGWRRRP